MRQDNEYYDDIQTTDEAKQKAERLLIQGLRQFAIDPEAEFSPELHAKVMARVGALSSSHKGWLGSLQSWLRAAWHAPLALKAPAIASVLMLIVVYGLTQWLTSQFAAQQTKLERIATEYTQVARQLQAVKQDHEALQTQVREHQAHLGRVETQYAQMERQLHASQQEYAALQAQLTEQMESLDRSQAELQHVKITLEEREQQLTAQTAEQLKGQIRQVQEQLQKAGFDPGSINGILGPQTVAALRRYQSRQGLPETGELDAATQRSLVELEGRWQQAKLKRHEGRRLAELKRQAGKYYALIVGNNNYRHLPTLATSVQDATEVDKILKTKYGFETELLLNATRTDMLSTLSRLRKKLLPQDNLLIYYAGHGMFESLAQEAYWLPVDAQEDDVANWILADSITSEVKLIPARHVLIVADSSFSGTLSRTANVNIGAQGKEREDFLKKQFQKPSRTLMASGGNAPVVDTGSDGHSVFARAFIRALTEIDESVFTAQELFNKFVKHSVASQAQTPVYNNLQNSGHDSGDFVFIQR